MKHRATLRTALATLALLPALLAHLHAAPPDATTDYIDTTYAYNLGPTGASGWIYSTGNEWLFTPEGLTTESRQIKVTRIETGSPADGVLQVNDVILGASGTAAAPLAFTSDARKTFGLAVGEAEKAENAGSLKLLVWRDGAVLPAPLQLTLQVMGSYSASAPFACPKSTAIITKACTLLASHDINSGYTEGNAVIGLALLGCVSSSDSYYTTVQTKLRAYARSVAGQNLDLTIPVNAMVAWPWGYNNVFLSEYYLATRDEAVLPAIRELTATCAAGQSLFGTYGHGMAWSKSDGSSTHGHVPTYGAVNQAGETVDLGIMLGRKALVAAGELATLDPEIDPAIERGRKYFGYFAGKGAVPYGHSPPEDLHDDNGKNGLGGLLMALQDQADMSVQARYFAKSCTAAYNLREMGHCGPFWAHLWQPLGVNVGGPIAMAAYFKQIQWELDLVRRWDGSFAYHTATGASPGATGLGADSDTACFLLTFATGMRQIYITGKGQSSDMTDMNYISDDDITEAIADGVYSLRTDLNTTTTTSSDQLLAFLGSWSPQKRNWAAAALANRADAATKVATLLTMAADLTNLNARKGACQALGQIKGKLSAAQLTSAATVLRDRLTDSDYHVRYYAAEALKALGSSASGVLTNMLDTLVTNAQPIEPVDWNDPCQIAYSYLSSAVFDAQLGGSVGGVSSSTLYPAIRAVLPSLGRNSLISTFSNALTLNDVKALAPEIVTALMTDHTICNEWLADACIRTLAKYNIEEAIPAAMLFENFESGRSWFPNGIDDSKNALQKFGATAAATLPALTYWNNNGYDLASTIATIQNDTASHTLTYFKSISSCGASSTTVALPAGSTTLSATASDIDGHSAALVYSWSKVRGAGGVTFSANGTTASSNTIASFNTPGTYVIRLGVTDGVLDPNKYGPVTRDLTITVLADSNRPPVAANQNVTTPVNTAKAVTLAASDADGNTLSYSVVTNPASGTLTGTAPNLTYTPASGFSGTTSFTYKANDGTLDSGIATVTITVGTSTNTTPVANNQVVTTPEDTAVAITLTGTDADAGTTLTYAIVAQPAHGTLTGTGASGTYTPAANSNGTDSFSFTVSDGTATSGVATVVIQVSAVNDAPVASAQSLTTPESTAIAITLAGSDPEGYAVTYQVSGTPGHGTLSGTAPNLTYTPTTLYNGTDSLAFTVTDSEGVVSPAATVSITVTPVNQAPVALNRSLPVTLNTATAIVLSGTDLDNNPLTYTVLSQPAHGALTGTAPNLTYTPAAGYNSTDRFTFKVNDGTVDSDVATVFLSMGTIYSGIQSEFFQQPPDLYSWPDMASIVPNDTRIDTQIDLSHDQFPAGYEDRFSSRHITYVNIPTSGYYHFSASADDNVRLYVDETWVMQTVYGQAGWSKMPLYLTAGYHGLRVEFVESYGDNYVHLSWSGPGVSGVVPANVFFRCVGSTAPAVPTHLACTPLDSAIFLTWSGSPVATSYSVKRSVTPGGPYATVATAVTTTSFSDTTALTGTVYYYVVSATGAGGESGNSNETYAMAVTTVTINVALGGSRSTGAANLMNGTLSSDGSQGTGNQAAPVAYAGSTWNDVGGTAASKSGLLDSKGASTTVGFSLNSGGYKDAPSDWAAAGRLRLFGAGCHADSGNGGGYQPNPETLPALTITGLDATKTYNLYLAGDDRDATVNQYNIGGTFDFTTRVFTGGVTLTATQNPENASTWVDGVSYVKFAGLTGSTSIKVQDNATSGRYVLNGFQLVQVGAQPPAVPNDLTASAASARVDLSWSAASGATGYMVKRATAFGGPYAVLGTTAATAWSDTTAVNGTTYYYLVSATNSAGESSNSTAVGATPAVPLTVPAAPTNLTATPGSNNVSLAWKASNGAAGYNVKRSLTNGGSYATIGTSSGTSYGDATAVNGTVYYYVVSATNGAGEGANSSQASATPSVQPSTTTLVSFPLTAGASGATVTFTATVSVSGGPATGTVTFKDGTTVLGAGTLALGQATFATSALVVGPHSITANYDGDSTFVPSVSSAVAYTVTSAVVAVSASNSTVVASPVAVAADGVATSTITVTLKDSTSNPVAGKTVTLAKTSGPGSPVIATLAGTTDSSGLATFTVKSTTAGTAVFTATDVSDSVTVNQTASVTFTAAAGLITWGPATDDTLNAGSTAFVATDVKTNGQFVAAVCNGGAGTVNGVIFTGADSYNTAGTYLITYGASPITMQWAGSRGDVNWGSPSQAYGNFGYDNGTNTKLLLTGGGEGLSPNTITLSSLIAGNTYQVQIWAPTWNNTFNISVGGATLRVGDPPGSLSQNIVGTFTANAASQTISCAGIAPSAISLRDVTSAPPATAYETWASNDAYTGVDLSNPAADADHDGLSNFHEFAFGLDPTVGASANPCTPLRGTQFSYTKRATSGLSYTVEYSTDLTTWNPATASESAGAADSNGIQTVTVTVSNPALNGKLFVRVQAR